MLVTYRSRLITQWLIFSGLLEAFVFYPVLNEKTNTSSGGFVERTLEKKEMRLDWEKKRSRKRVVFFSGNHSCKF